MLHKFQKGHLWQQGDGEYWS